MKSRISLFLFLVFSLVMLTGCDSSKSKTVVPENLTTGTYLGDISALFWIAKERGYYAEHGVNVELKTHESGLESLMDMLSGKVDLATITEFVFARQISKHPELRILSVIGQSDNMKLVARKDHGIKEISDLRNKRIGLVRRSIAEYHFQLFLFLHRIPWESIEIVDLPPSDEVKSIVQGDIDAVIVWEPFAKQMQERLGENAVSWAAQSGQDYYWVLVGTEDILKQKSSAINRLLTALASAENLVKKDRNEAKRIVASQIGSNHMPDLWETSDFTLDLSRPVILAMETEITWMNSVDGNQYFKTPDLLQYVHFRSLESINPEKNKNASLG